MICWGCELRLKKIPVHGGKLSLLELPLSPGHDEVLGNLKVKSFRENFLLQKRLQDITWDKWQSYTLCTLHIRRNNAYLICRTNQTYWFASKCIFLSAKQAVRSHSLIDFKATFCMYGNWSFDHSLLCEVIHEVTPHRYYLSLYRAVGDRVISQELPVCQASYRG